MAKKLYGTDPDQVPTNADLGTMAYQDSANVVIDGGSARIDAARPASSNTARAELELYASGNAPTYIVNNSNRLAAGQHIAEFRGQWDGTAVARMVVAAGTDTTNKDDGVLSFWTASAGTMAKAAEFTSGGNLAFPNGQGIDFSATGSGSGTMTSELLDDYEEGTWTSEFNIPSGSVTYNTGTGGVYTKIGRMVHVSAWIYINSLSSPSGTLTLTLPFTNQGNVRASQVNVVNRWTGVTGLIGCWMSNSSATLNFVTLNNGTMGGSALNGTNMMVNGEMYINFSYES